MWQGCVTSPNISLLALSPIIEPIRMNPEYEYDPEFNRILFQDIRFYNHSGVAMISVSSESSDSAAFHKIFPIDFFPIESSLFNLSH